jgi:hypothetical protein
MTASPADATTGDATSGEPVSVPGTFITRAAAAVKREGPGEVDHALRRRRWRGQEAQLAVVLLLVRAVGDQAEEVNVEAAVLAQVHEVVRAADDIDPALAACVQLPLAGPHLAPDSPSAPPPMTLSAFGMNLRVRVSFKAPWRSPAAHADMDAHQFLARLCDMIDHRWQVLPCRSGPMGQVSVLARVSTGASWGRLGISRPLGLRSLLGCKAADLGQLPRYPVGICAATRSPRCGSKLVQFWFVFPTHRTKVA